MLLLGSYLSSATPEKYTFENLPIIYKYDKKYPIIAIEVFIKIGSINEPKEKAGITNLVQSTISKGTKNRTAEQIATEIESIGASLSFSTSEDYSKISLCVATKHIKKAVDILFDILLNPTFPETEIEKEKQSILAGLKMRKDYIHSTAMDELLKNLYGEHPYSRIVSGTEETVKELKREEIVSWHRKFYGHPNLLLVVVGNIRLKNLKKILTPYIKDIPQTEQATLPQKDIKPQKQYIEIKSEKFKQSYLAYGFLMPSVTEEDYTKLKLLDAYIGGGMSSELFEIIREDVGFAYEVDSFYPSRLHKSHMVIYMGLDEKNISEAKRRINQLLENLKNGKIDHNKVENTKRYIKGVYLLQHQTYSNQAHFLGLWEILGKTYKYDEIYIQELAKITPSNLIEVSQKYFQPENTLILEITPK